MLATTPSTETPPRSRATWRLVTISVWGTPVLIVGQFAMT
ncbi:hypothetical protein BC739_007897 [Kutzneria viridogrisea]|uniref:Uncharacterized protein n=2 Tax=Kutzneria TaxID=43356 RepID=W5WGY9_9PSEU|nr:hypothetical protein KALB_4065 [Kutzneria albida DSM 43870]MBA8930650.1 hypothetical protein [Kutzneria viridogrisea]